jgi:hypothetical protein
MQVNNNETSVKHDNNNVNIYTDLDMRIIIPFRSRQLTACPSTGGDPSTEGSASRHARCHFVGIPLTKLTELNKTKSRNPPFGVIRDDNKINIIYNKNNFSEVINR